MTALTGLITREFETGSAARARRHERFERIREVLARGGLSVVFRPVFDLRSLTIVGYEALTRFRGGGGQEGWFAEAAEIGLGPDLERAAHQVALAHLEDLPSHADLWLNLSRSAIDSSTVRDMLAAVPRDRIIVGLARTNTDEPGLDQAISDLRASGFRVAIHQVGTGSTALVDIFRLQPDFLRLDAGAVRAIHADGSRRDLVRSLVQAGSEVGAVIVAEAIETRRIFATLRDLGVTFGQGNALAPLLSLADLPG